MPRKIWIFAIFAITAILADFAVKAKVAGTETSTRFCQDDKSREKYCRSANPDDIELCLRWVFCVSSTFMANFFYKPDQKNLGWHNCQISELNWDLPKLNFATQFLVGV